MPKIQNSHRLVVAVLQEMWDWNSKTSEFGYVERAPEYFIINKDNFTGSRLYGWLGKQGEHFDELLVTNACPELVTSARGRGKPDKKWLSANLLSLQPFQLLLVCGRVAQQTYHPGDAGDARIIELPHPAARGWTTVALRQAGEFIRHGTHSLDLKLVDGRIKASLLIPF